MEIKGNSLWIHGKQITAGLSYAQAAVLFEDDIVKSEEHIALYLQPEDLCGRLFEVRIIFKDDVLRYVELAPTMKEYCDDILKAKRDDFRDSFDKVRSGIESLYGSSDLCDDDRREAYYLAEGFTVSMIAARDLENYLVKIYPAGKEALLKMFRGCKPKVLEKIMRDQSAGRDIALKIYERIAALSEETLRHMALWFINGSESSYSFGDVDIAKVMEKQGESYFRALFSMDLLIQQPELIPVFLNNDFTRD